MGVACHKDRDFLKKWIKDLKAAANKEKKEKERGEKVREKERKIVGKEHENVLNKKRGFPFIGRL